MKRKISRIVTGAMAGILMIGMVGCSNPANNNSVKEYEASSSSSEQSQTQVQSQTFDNVDITWFSDVSGWGPSGWSSGTVTSPLLDAVKEDYGISFTFEQPPTEAATKLGLMIASDDLPDMITLSDGESIKQLIDSGKVWTMEEFYETYDPESHIVNNFPEDIKQAVIRKFGDWYSFPSHQESKDSREIYPITSEKFVDNVTKGRNTSIMFNRTLMEALNITEEDVRTEAGFYEACKKVKESGYTVDGQSVMPVVLQHEGWIGSSLDGIISATFGVVPVDGEGNYRRIEMNPGYKSALKFVNTLIRNEYLDMNTLTIDETALNTYLDAGRVFCWIGNPAQNGNKQDIPFESFGPILAENGAQPVTGVNLMAGSGWLQTFISKSCKNPEQVAKAFTFMTGKEGLFLNQYGIEGEDYTVEGGIVTRTESGEQKWVNTYKNNMWLWPINNTDFEWSTAANPEQGSSDYAHWQTSTAMGRYENTYIYDIALFSFETGNYLDPASDLGIKETQIKNYLESQKGKIVSAQSDDAFEKEYQNMIDTLTKYAVEEIASTYNELFKENCEAQQETVENVNFDIYE